MLAIYDGMSNAEIARELNLPVRVVENGKKRLHRAGRRMYADEDEAVAAAGGRAAALTEERRHVRKNRPSWNPRCRVGEPC